jgi:hypothetical protein
VSFKVHIEGEHYDGWEREIPGFVTEFALQSRTNYLVAVRGNTDVVTVDSGFGPKI